MSIIRDASLAPAGLKKIEWVRSHMPALSEIEKQFEADQPFKGLKIAVSVHLEAKTANLGLVLKIVGEEYNDKYAQGQIISQNFTVGSTVSTGTEIEVHVSKGVEPMYFNVNYMVQAPSDYAGGDAGIVLVEPTTGQQIWATTTSVFPVQINITGLYMISDL